jgi:cysteine-S-conjugate beta-lyase
MKTFKNPETLVTHGIIDPNDFDGVVNPPVYRASTITHPNMAHLAQANRRLANDEDGVVTYGRRGTPSTYSFQQAIAALEGGYRSRIYPSGLAACAASMLAFLKAGDHLLMTDSAYAPARHVAKDLLPRYGIEVQFFDPCCSAEIATHFKPNTRLVYCESPGSHTFEVQDIPAIARAAHARDIWVAVDNTWASPLYCKPLQLGADISVQAATKYVVGHSDASIGTITTNQAAWKSLFDYTIMTGQTAGTEEVYLAQRGLRTMPTRLRVHHANSLTIAQWLERRPEVARVLHPALPSHPQHALWQRDFTGASGLFSVVFKPEYSAVQRDAFIDALTLFAIGYSWGGFESLVIPIAPQSERDVTTWPYPGPGVRLHIGLEHVDDLISDLEGGLYALRPH